MSERVHDSRGGTILILIVGPTIWALHFLGVYVTAAVFCAKTGGTVELWPVRVAIVVLTALSLAAIAVAALRAWQKWGVSLDRDLEYEAPSPVERRRFLSHAALMLNALSTVSVIYTALPALFVSSCL